MELVQWGLTQVNQYLDIVFARQHDATVVQAVFLTLLGFIAIYVIFAGSAWWLVKRSSTATKINSRPLRSGQLIAEVKASILTIIIFGLLAGVTFSLLKANV